MKEKEKKSVDEEIYMYVQKKREYEKKKQFHADVVVMYVFVSEQHRKMYKNM